MTYPEPPRWLSANAKRHWRRVIPLMAGLDRTAVTIYVKVLARIDEARAHLAQEGLAEQERGLWERLLADREGQARELAGELGLTPTSRLGKRTRTKNRA